MNLKDVKPGPFEPPDWPTFLETRRKAWIEANCERSGAYARTIAKVAFDAGWRACMDELGQSSRGDER